MQLFGPRTTISHRPHGFVIATVLAAIATLVAGASAHAGLVASASGSAETAETGAKAPISSRGRVWPPTPSSVGVPAGTELKPYRGSCTITKAGKVIKNKLISCPQLEIRTTGVVIQGSKINGSVLAGAADDSDPTGKGPVRVTVLDSEIDSSSVPDFRPIGVSHFVVKRSYLHGSFSGGHCHNACKIKRSFVTGSSSHASGLRVLRNSRLKHNTIWCEPDLATSDGGCSGNLTMYEEFGTPYNNVLKHNYFPGDASWYSLKFNGEDGGSIRIIDNLFGKSWAGNADDWDRKASNVWTGNRMTSGKVARP